YDPKAGGKLATTLPAPSPRAVFLLQRTTSRIRKDLSKTTCCVHRTALNAKGDAQIAGMVYDRIADECLHISVGGTSRVLDVDNVIVCAGQESVRDLVDGLAAAGITTHVIGGADVAAELDAKRAIKQGTEVAAAI